MIQIDIWWFVGLLALAYSCGVLTAVGDLMLWNKPTGVAQPTMFRWQDGTKRKRQTPTK